jgi:hypothetical protein
MGVVEKISDTLPAPTSLARSCGSPAHSWKRPLLTAFPPETPPFSRACYPNNLVVENWKFLEILET